MVPDRWHSPPVVAVENIAVKLFEQQESIMPILLWLLGLPVGLIIVLMLLGAA